MKLFFEIIGKDLYRFLTNSNYREYLKLAIVYGDKERRRKHKIKFLDVEFEVPDCRSFIPQYKDIFVEEDYKFNSDKNQPLIYDCGANIGMSALYFKKLYRGAIIKAFEADPNIAGILTSNIHHNRISDVEIINKAVWINDNGVDISEEGADAASIFSNKGKIQVDSIRLKNLIEGEDSIDMLKMDIEGAELDVIKDCSSVLSEVQNIFIEFHSFLNMPQSLSQILEILEFSGFRYFVENVNQRKKPLVNKTKVNSANMDLQLNIYAYKL